MNIQTLKSVQQQCEGVAEIDYFFAKAITALISDNTVKPGDGLDDEHDQSVQVFMVFVALSYAQRQGHSCLPFTVLAGQRWWQNEETGGLGFQFATHNKITKWLENVIDYLPEPSCVRIESSCLYTQRYWQFEQDTQSALNKLHRITPVSKCAKERLTAVWDRLFPNSHPPKEENATIDWQQIAVVLALHQGLTVLSGGPGTGKTYTVARILLALSISAEAPLRIQLAAPTGKAAQRLTESLNHGFTSLSAIPELADVIDSIPTQAQTVHRLLGLREHDVGAKYNAENKLTLDVLIVDESSMLDLALMTRLLRALPDDCRLILVGDAQQLPSVESGNVLPMLMPKQTNLFSSVQQHWLSDFNIHYKPDDAYQVVPDHNQKSNPCIVLARSHRFGEKLAQLATAINQQGGELAWDTLTTLSKDRDSGVELIQEDVLKTTTLESISDNYFRVCCAESLAEAFKQAKQFRVLAAMRQGESGVELLNQKIEDNLRKRLGIAIGQVRFQGQLLMVSRNIHALGLYNGDIGIVWPDQSGNLSLFFEADTSLQFRSFDLNRVPSIQSVYAMTIHKSQGSEFAHVLIVLPRKGGQSLLSRELLYTAVTRSQKRLSIVSEQAVFVQAVSNRTQRYSGLQPVAGFNENSTSLHRSG